MQNLSGRKPGGVIIRQFLVTYVLLMGIALLLIGLEPVQKIVDINGIYWLRNSAHPATPRKAKGR